jgi:polar amino acid transport system permease protein
LALDPNVVLTNIQALAAGAWMTLFVSFISIAIGVAGGLVLCFALLSNNRALRALAHAYVSFFRGTPLLVQLLMAYYFVPPLIRLDAPPLAAAIAALALNTSAFQAEIYRGGILALPRGQFEAARVLGITVWQARRKILIPQMMRLVLPSLVNETISILKNSSLVSVIAVTDLIRVSQQIVAVTFRPTEIYFATAIIYLAMTFLLAAIGRAAERRLGKHI